MAGCKLVGLVRVSTDKQGKSGLGLEGQLAAIEAHRERTGCTLLKTYTEVESGTHDELDDRPQLMAAIAHARRSKAVLVIAKLDRLVRSQPVLAALKKSGVQFVACDNPNANELTVDILVAVAANEARAISDRTKAALAAYKARGGLLGASLPQCRNLTDDARQKGVENASKARTAAASEAYADLAPWMAELRGEGKTLAEIAATLNEEGHTTRTGKPWNPVQVSRVLQRLS